MKNRSESQLSKIFEYLKRYKLLVFFTILSAVILSMFEVFSTLYIEVFVDTIKDTFESTNQSIKTLIYITIQY